MSAVNPANPQSWNRYTYVANAPLSATDPLGLDSDGCFGGDSGSNRSMECILPDGGGPPTLATSWPCIVCDYPWLPSLLNPTIVNVIGSLDGANNCQALFLDCNPRPRIPTISQWHPPKSKDYITAPPGPYKPTVTDCMTGPNDAADKLLASSAPIEHDPQAGMALVKSSYQDTSRGNNPSITAETVEQAGSVTVFFAGFFNWIGCMANAVF